MNFQSEQDQCAILKLKDIYKDFDGLKVLSGVSLQINKHERHALIGPNGAGKSTLFNIITGKYKLSSGKILFKGQDITNLTPFRLSRLGISRSFQITNIFQKMTVFSNIRNAILSRNKILFNFHCRLSRMDSVNDQSEKLLNQIGLYDQKDQLAGELSYGQQRVLEIGQAIGTDPELILLDEPTAGMTSEETKEMVKFIDRITAGKTLIIVEHDMDVVFRIADNITVLNYGKVLCSGPCEDVRNDKKVKEVYLGGE